MLSCKGTKSAEGSNSIMIEKYELTINKQQLDSICLVDTLSSLDKWIVSSYRDYETKKGVNKYLYIKSLGAEEQIYILSTPNDSIYNIIKRITYTK
jgi:hypothetical protein